MFYSKRYSANSGLNSANLDFFPVQNIEEIVEVMGVGAVPVGKFVMNMQILLQFRFYFILKQPLERGPPQRATLAWSQQRIRIAHVWNG
jgi:hypothetical protein